MKKIQELLENKIPFAIVQYFETAIFDSTISNKVYEVIYIAEIKDKKGKNKNKICKVILGKNGISYFKSIVNNLVLQADTEDGKVWDFLDFKTYMNNHLKEKNTEV